MENAVTKGYLGVINTLRVVSDIILFIGIIAGIIIVINGFSDKGTTVEIGTGVGYIIASIFINSLGKVIAIIAEIQVNNYKSKQD